MWLANPSVVHTTPHVLVVVTLCAIAAVLVSSCRHHQLVTVAAPCLAVIKSALHGGLLCITMDLLLCYCVTGALQEAQTGDSSERVVFQNNVLGLRSGGEFKWGKPFVADAAVEVEVLEEFPGPVVTVAAGIPEADTDVMMARYRVKTIRNSSSAH